MILTSLSARSIVNTSGRSRIDWRHVTYRIIPGTGTGRGFFFSGKIESGDHTTWAQRRESLSKMDEFFLSIN